MLDPNFGQLIGLTGGIGSGKTFALNCFKIFGFETWSADKIVGDLLATDPEIFKEIKAHFPTSIVSGKISKSLLAETVFANSEMLTKLENILYPKLRLAQLEYAQAVALTTKKSIVFEVPLLFENARQNNFDIVVAMIVDAHLQKIRVFKARNNMTNDRFNAIIKKQVSNEVRVRLADIIIDANKTKSDTFRQIKSVIINGSFKRDNIRYRDDRSLRQKW